MRRNKTSSTSYDFNPRTHEGCDRSERTNISDVPHISIHAPMKGATRCTSVTGRFSFYFNPRTHEGCDEKQIGLVKIVGSISIHAPMKGATKEVIRLIDMSMISIHAPMKGATRVFLAGKES